MVGILQKVMPVPRSISCKEFVDFDADISIALEYTGTSVNCSTIPRVVPVDVDRIPTAKVAFSPTLLNDLLLPVAEPVVRSKFRASQEVRLGCGVRDLKNLVTPYELGLRDANVSEHNSTSRVFDRNGELKGFEDKRDDEIESSGTLGFSDSQDHSHGLPESSDTGETPVDCQEIENFENCLNSAKWNSNESSFTPQAFSAEIWCEEEEASDGEALECRRRRRKPAVSFCGPDTAETVGEEEWEEDEDDESVILERRVAEKPAKRGACYHCHRGNRFTEKEACIVCNAKYCKHCIRKVMGTMAEGRKCVACIGHPVDESKRCMLGKCSRLLKDLLLESEVKQVMVVELSCRANQPPPDQVFVNGSPLSLKELMILRNCPKPPRNLRQGNYWYDKVAGFWGKEGERPYQIITPQLNIGGSIKRDASNGATDIQINGREITKAEKWMLQWAGVQCAGNPCFWVDSDGTCQEEGMKQEKGKIWGRKRTKLLCTLLSLPTPESPNPGGLLKLATNGEFQGYPDQKALCKILLVGNDRSGMSTVYKQARFLYGIPFSEEEHQDIKSMIQRNLYRYLVRLLEGREQFEEESLEERKRQSYCKPGPSATPSEILEHTEYTIGKKIKPFSDWLVNIMVSGNLDMIFPDASLDYAPYVEEMWKDAAIQATYSRRDELDLPSVASYFLDKAVEVTKADYVPSDTDILYAEGFTSNGLVSMEFSFPQTLHDCYKEPSEQPDCVTNYQLVKVHAASLGKNCKWLEMFEGIRIVMFCVALTEYDEYEVDSSGVLTNKMLESRRLFESIVTHPTFADTNFLLLLNKFDLLENKIEQVPLTRCDWFQDFNAVFSHHHSSRTNSNNMAPLAQRAFHYIATKFKRLYSALTERKLYVCPVTALESDFVDSALKYAGEIVKWEENKLSFSLNEYSSESIDIEQSSYSRC